MVISQNNFDANNVYVDKMRRIRLCRMIIICFLCDFWLFR